MPRKEESLGQSRKEHLKSTCSLYRSLFPVLRHIYKEERTSSKREKSNWRCRGRDLHVSVWAHERETLAHSSSFPAMVSTDFQIG
jgi:hypothetical protein